MVNLLSRWKSWNHMEHYFWPQICWSTFTPEYLRINNDDKSYSQSQICRDRRESPNIRKGVNRFLKGSIILSGYFGYWCRVNLNKPGFAWQHRNVSTLHQWAWPWPLFCPRLPLSLINLQFWVYHDLQSTDRCPAASLEKEERELSLL